MRHLFGNAWVLLAGRVDCLAFDLMIGAVCTAWMDWSGIGRLVQAPLLVCVLPFGPLGLLLIQTTRGRLEGLHSRRFAGFQPQKALP